MALLALSMSAGVSRALAPGATTMQFSPSSSTVISAIPEGESGSEKRNSEFSFSDRKSSFVWRPNRSSPVFAIRVTFPFSLAAATAWLAPLPPGFVRKSPPKMVSPGRGSLEVFITMSVLVLPMTVMRLWLI